jgi:hypothetical protein
VRFEVLTDVAIKITVFWDVTLCSPIEVYRRFGGKYCPYHHSSALKIETARSSKTSVNFHRITPRHIPEYSTFNYVNKNNFPLKFQRALCQ